MYPEIEPYATHRVRVGQSHVLYVEESGNLEGIPVIFLHGGPGSACKAYHRQFFDPKRYRIILLDQRGCGRSEPFGEIDNNITWDIVEDMETVRYQLDIEQWLLFGGSWGATLALLYAETYPACVKGLILRGTFLSRQRDIDWFYDPDGVARIFPEQWANFIRRVPEKLRDQPLAFHHQCLMGKDKAAAQASSLDWAAWGGCVVSYAQFPAPTDISEKLLAGARIECHYVYNRCFLQENQIMDNLDVIRHLPCILIHGQRDLVCPAESSVLIKQHWPSADLHMVLEGGHLAHTAPMEAALVQATDEMAVRLG